MEKYITQNGIKYELKGEQYYPMLEIAEQKEHKIGKYGLLHLDFIKKHRRGTYTTLLTEGRLNAHLHEIDVQANEMVEAMVDNLARERGIDEELKASDAIKWVAEMNNIKSSAEEIVLREVIYQ
ncbi:MAG: TnpV protein [Clostridia bacterium]|nr:TnpV protein [Clostridia bacterium]